jgi:hypothetical protein
VIAHEYGDIDTARIWVVAAQRLGELITMLDALIPPLPDDDSGM